MPHDKRTPRRQYGTGSIIEHRGSWYGKFRDASGRQLKRKLGAIRAPGSRDGLTRKMAEAELRRKMAEDTAAAPRELLTVAEVGARYLTHLGALGRKRSTLGEYESMLRVHLAPHFTRAIDRVTPGDVEAYIAAKGRAGLSPKSVRNHLGLLHSIFTYAERRSWARGNPCQHVEAPRAAEGEDIRYLDAAELAALLQAAGELIEAVPELASGRTVRAGSLRRVRQLDRVLYLTAALTGLRQGELLGLRWRDIDWTAGRVRVRRAWVRGEMGSPKSKRSTRAVPLATTVARELELHSQRSAYAADDDLVFAHPDTGAPLDRSKLLKRFKAAAKRAGLREVRFHDLRHTFGTRMAAAGTPMRTLQEWMGHRDFKTTLIYADYAPGEHEAELIERAFGSAAVGATA
jgi:integrase